MAPLPNVVDQCFGQNFALYQGDSIEVIDGIPSDSVGLSIFSPPFSGMYAYSNSVHDIGNTTGIEEMITHFRYLVNADKLLRVTMPGRLSCVHLMQLTAMKSRDGYIGIKDYRGKVIQMMEEEGWVYAGEVCIDKNPQVQATRNKERGLLFKSLANDSSVMRMALADYLLCFRKPGENPEPIRAGMSAKYNPNGGWITEAEWVEWAAPVWYRQVAKGTTGLPYCPICGEGSCFADHLPEEEAEAEIRYRAEQRRRNAPMDGYPGKFQETQGIRETDVLNVVQARETDDERHLCPLQLGVIERAVKLWSNPNDLIFSPFAGIGSEGYQSLLLKRRFIGIELKQSYWKSAVQNLQDAERKATSGTLFSLLESVAA